MNIHPDIMGLCLVNDALLFFVWFLFFWALVEFEAVSSGTEVDLVKRATCSAVDIQNNKQYLVMGASGSEVTLSHSFKSVSLHLSLTCSSSSSFASYS